jgi:hypothetical protein
MKNVDDLRDEELQELRNRWYHQHLDDGSLFEVVGTLEEEEIPMSLIKDYYSDTYFVEEDFFCNIEN